MITIQSEFDSDLYWEQRYANGIFSGCGSVGERYRFKRDFINAVVRKFKFNTVIDFGCGDGTQIQELLIPDYYGLDVSPTVVESNRRRYSDRFRFRFDLVREAQLEYYDLAMSIDVIYHVTRQEQYEEYLRMIFAYSQYTLIYGNFTARESPAEHMVFRDHTAAIKQLGIPTTLLGKYPLPNKPIFGFAFYQNRKESEDPVRG